MTRRAGLDKASVVEEAAKLINEDGLAQLSLGSLAERLGVRVPSLYNHVAGLAGLKHDLTIYCLRELREKLTQAVLGKARGEAIFALADAFRDYARGAPGHYAFTLRAPSPDDQAWQELGQQNVKIISAVLAPYRLGERETIHAIRSLRSIIQGFISLETAGGFGILIDVDESFHWLITLFIAGLERPAGAS